MSLPPDERDKRSGEEVTGKSVRHGKNFPVKESLLAYDLHKSGGIRGRHLIGIIQLGTMRSGNWAM
jgi:hypothetical protein